MIVNRKVLAGLDSREYEHPADKLALANLTKIPILPAIVKKIIELVSEKQILVVTEGSNIEISAKQYPKLYSMYLECCKILDIEKIPKFYLEAGRDINAYTTGVETPIVCVNEGTFEALPEEELRFIIGHELGHIKSEHCLYHTIARLLSSGVAAKISKLAFPITEALLAWDRKSEYTADRAGLLCCQNAEASISALGKLGGCVRHYKEEFNLETYLRQALDFKTQQGSLINGLKEKAFYILYDVNHPLSLLRAAEIYEWKDSEQYTQILSQRQTLMSEVTA